MAEQNVGKENKGDKKIFTVILALLIAVLWLAIFILLIKLDVGGFGSGVLRPILKDVPVLNLILPDISDEQLAKDHGYEYTSLSEANQRINELEAILSNMVPTDDPEFDESLLQLEAEIKRLKVFEEEQEKFKQRQEEFDKNVVFAQEAPDIEEYKNFYEGINPANAETIYRQVVEQLQYSASVIEKADIYKNMDPGAAASILEEMSADLETVSQILLSMRPSDSAEIMAEMDSAYAAKITKKMLDMDAERLNN